MKSCVSFRVYPLFLHPLLSPSRQTLQSRRKTRHHRIAVPFHSLHSSHSPHHFSTEAATEHALHHPAHFGVFLNQRVHLLHRGARAARDATPPVRVQDYVIHALCARH